MGEWMVGGMTGGRMRRWIATSVWLLLLLRINS